MMALKYGDQWAAWLQADLFLVTANACTHIDQEGLDPLVMGAGIARQARDRFPGLEVRLSQVIRPDNVHVWQHRRVTRAVHCDREPYDVSPALAR